MKIIVIGATGTIGSALVKSLMSEHEIIKVGNKNGDFNVDLSSSVSIRELLGKIGPIDALVSAAGQARFGPLNELTEDDYLYSIGHKLMGQVNLYRVGREYLNENGSITLTSGILSVNPMVGSSAVSLVNSGLEGFVRAAALETEKGQRINAVSPGWVKETMEAMGMDSSGGTPAAKVADLYSTSLFGSDNGRIISF